LDRIEHVPQEKGAARGPDNQHTGLYAKKATILEEGEYEKEA